MKAQLKYRQELRNIDEKTGALWVRIGGGWFTSVDGKKKYEELPVSLSVRVPRSGKLNASAKMKLSRLDILLAELNTVAVAEKRKIEKDEVKEKLSIQEIANIRSVNVAAVVSEQDGTISKVISKYIQEKEFHVSQNYLRIYKTLQYYFERYDDVMGKPLRFSNFDRELYKNFWTWQNKVYKGEIVIDTHGKGRGRNNLKGFAPDSLRKYQKAFYQVAEYAQHLGIATALQNTKYERNLLINPKGAMVPKKFLTLEEIQSIVDYVPTSDALKNARQFLVISCLTGQRFETMQTLDKSVLVRHKTGFTYSNVYYNKTKVDVVLPFFPSVLVETNGFFPTFKSNVVLNRDIKKVCEAAGISDWQDITTHTGKRSFYSNLAAADVPASIIELITHPKRKDTAMQAIYDNRLAITRAEQFFKYLSAVEMPSLYSFKSVHYDS